MYVGNAPLDEMSNIFDLEGNYSEWTAEEFDTSGRVFRGGNYDRVGVVVFRPASYRNCIYPTNTNGMYSSRLALMVAL